MIPFAMMSLSGKDDLDRFRCNCPYSYKKIFSMTDPPLAKRRFVCNWPKKTGHYHPAILKSAKYQLQSMSLLFCLSTIKGVSSFCLWKPVGHGRNPFDIQA